MDDSFVVKSHDVSIDRDYINWLHEIKDRYRTSQIKAAIRVNSEKLLFNWQLGRDLVMRKAEQRWGSGVVEQVALDLQREFPGNGFSVRNVSYMKQWYLFYYEKLQRLVGEINPLEKCISEKLQRLVAELQSANNQNVIKLQQIGKEIDEENVDGIPFPAIFGYIPWGSV